MSRVVLLPVAFATAFVLVAAGPMAAPASGERAALRQRALALFERREEARSGGVPLDPLARQLGALADTLESAALDSLAANARYRLAGVLNRLGRRVEAEGQLRRAVATALRARDERLELRARLLLVDLTSARQPDEAIAAARALRPRLEARRDTLGLGDVHGTLARAYGLMGRWQESLAEARRSHRQFVRAGHERNQAFALGQMSAALRFLGRHAEAGIVTDSAIALGRRHALGLSLSRALLEGAALARVMGRPERSLDFLEEALAIDRQTGDLSHEISTRQARTSALLDLSRTAEALAENDSLLRLPSVGSDPVRLVHARVSRGALLLELGRAAEAESLVVAALASYEAHVAGLGTEENRAAARTHALGAASVLAIARTELEGAAAGWAALDAGRAATLKQALGVREPPVDAVLAGLRESRTAIVQYAESMFEERIAFVLTADGVRIVRRRQRSSPDDLRLVRSRLPAEGPRAARAALERLSADLLEGLLDPIGPDVRRLVIVPTSVFEDLPFEALPLPGGRGGTLGERWAVSYAPSVGVLAALEALPASRGGVVAFADPEVASLPRLPASRDEARRAAGGGVLVQGRDATRERLAREAVQAGVLHLATHAVAEPGAPGRRALLLAGTGGVLTAAAVESLGCASDLVVLSGCSTAGGTRYRGEAAFGLTRAFLAGGSRSVLATRWDVRDASAARFMSEFYRHLRSGLARDEALRRARVARAAAGDPDAWAFTLTGVGSEPVRALVSGGRPGGSRK